jgi:hypothetical protein
MQRNETSRKMALESMRKFVQIVVNQNY